MLDIFRDVFFEKDQMLERTFVQNRLDVFIESPVGNEDRACAGVGKNVVNLFERLRRVDGNVDRAETENREVGDGPFRTILRKQSNAIAWPYAERSEAERHTLHALAE